MTVLLFHFMRGAVALALAAMSVAAQANAPRPSVAAFFESSSFSTPRLSPNGKLLAVIVGAAGKRDRLVVVDLASNRIFPTAGYADVDIATVQWVNNERLLYDTAKKEQTRGEIDLGPGLFAVDYDGKRARQLARLDNSMVRAPSAIVSKLLPYHTYMMDTPGAQDSDAVYVRSLNFDKAQHPAPVALLQVDTVSGDVLGVPAPPGNPQLWVLDQQGAPRIAATLEGGMTSIFHRDRTTQTWKELAKFNVYQSKSTFFPLAFGADGTLYVSADGGNDKTAVHTLNTATGVLSDKALISLADYDFSGSLIFSKGKLLGLRTRTDAETTIWLDVVMKKVQEDIDAVLKNTMNLISIPRRPETAWVMVESYSDVQPMIVRLYNTETKAFNLVGQARPAIDPTQMGQQEMVSYKARDGMTIPALLTMPRGAQKAGLPMVVLVHGGPWVRALRGAGTAIRNFSHRVATPCSNPISEARQDTGMPTTAPGSSSGAWPCKMTSPTAPSGPLQRVSAIRRASASLAPVMAATPP